jgi:hypothetical protein
MTIKNKLCLLTLIFVITEMIPVPFTPIIETGLKVISFEAARAEDWPPNYYQITITFQATDNGHISWGNTTIADENGNVFSVNCLDDYEHRDCLNEYPLSKGLIYSLKSII